MNLRKIRELLQSRRNQKNSNGLADLGEQMLSFLEMHTNKVADSRNDQSAVAADLYKAFKILAQDRD